MIWPAGNKAAAKGILFIAAGGSRKNAANFPIPVDVYAIEYQQAVPRWTVSV